MREEKYMGPISRGSIEYPFGGPRYDSDFKRETTYQAIQPYNEEKLTGGPYDQGRQNPFLGDN